MKKFFSIILMLTMSVVLLTLTSCGGSDGESDDDNGDKIDNTGGNSGKIDNTGGNGKDALAPSAEKAYLEETSRKFLSYFNANEFEEMSNVWRGMSDKNTDDISDWLDFIMEKTLTDSYSSSWYSYEYYDALIRVANINGTFTSSYANKKWTRSDSENLTINYTDQNNAKWVLTINPSGSTKGQCYIGKYWNESEDTEKEYKVSVEVPEKINAKLTRQGETKATVELTINSIGVDNNNLSVMKNSNATADVSLLQYNTTANFAYSPNGNSSVSATVKKGNTKLLSFNISGIPSVRNEELEYARNISAYVDVLGSIQIHATCSNTKTLSDALNRAKDNEEDRSTVNNCASTANSAFTAYITNNGGNTQQAQIKYAVSSETDYGYRYYYLEPFLYFSDETMYSFKEYFSEKYFQTVIDNFNKIVNDFSDLAE